MTESEINKEAAKFFPPQRYPFGLAFSQDDVVAFAQHCVEKANGWQPIADAPKDGTPMLLCLPISEREACKDDRRVYEGKWCAVQNAFTSVNGFILLNNATHWKPLPPPEAA